MVTTQRQRSDRARLPMKTFLADRISGALIMVMRTREFPRNPTEIQTVLLSRHIFLFFPCVLFQFSSHRSAKSMANVYFQLEYFPKINKNLNILNPSMGMKSDNIFAGRIRY